MKLHVAEAVFIGMILPVVGLAGWKDDVGFTALQARLGGSTPTGLGIAVTQVEGTDSNGYYMPNTASTQFTGKTINNVTGSSSGISAHATIVASYYYGLTMSLSPGIDPIDVYEVNHWLNDGLLRLRTRYDPYNETRRIQNHSWAGSTGDNAVDIDALRRIDLLAERDGIVIVTAVENGTGTAIPKILSSAYNNIAVGLSNGVSSYGPTLIDLAGRVKPDIVVPPPATYHSKTSYVAPIVAGSASLLLQTTDANYAYLTQSQKALLAKALLMTGATKLEFPDWRKGFATPSTDGSVPLDYRYGAGELNIDNSHRILTAGEQEASATSDVSVTGWDIGTASSTTARQYFFDVPAPATFYVHKLSILVTWYRKITSSTGNPRVFTPSLANINLRLYTADGFVRGDLLDQSISSIDNIEHIYIYGLPAGRYVFEITSNASWAYAVAWDLTQSPTVRPDLDGDGHVDGDDYTLFKACATAPQISWTGDCAAPDLDDDGDIDQDDFAMFQRCYSGSTAVADPHCYP